MEVVFAYYSLTNNTRRFINKFEYSNFEIHDGNCDEVFDKKFILFVPTYETDVSYVADEFLNVNHENCIGIVGSGNINFDGLFCFTAKDLSEKYNIPIIKLIELSGSQDDVDYIKGVVDKLG